MTSDYTYDMQLSLGKHWSVASTMLHPCMVLELVQKVERVGHKVFLDSISFHQTFPPIYTEK
jgi:hypothetical protein